MVWNHRSLVEWVARKELLLHSFLANCCERQPGFSGQVCTNSSFFLERNTRLRVKERSAAAKWIFASRTEMCLNQSTPRELRLSHHLCCFIAGDVDLKDQSRSEHFSVGKICTLSRFCFHKLATTVVTKVNAVSTNTETASRRFRCSFD